MKLQHLATRLEIKASTDAGTIEGFGSIFGNEDSYGDIVAPGAFADSLKSGRAVKMLWQHDPGQPIGVWDEVSETDTGLQVKGRIAVDTQRGRDVLALLRFGSVDGLSIGFNTVDATFDKQSGVRVLTKLDLWEVSVVTFPANDKATLTSVKSRAEIDAMDIGNLEEFLREAGMSRDGAKGFLHRHATLIRQREADERATQDVNRALGALAARLRTS